MRTFNSSVTLNQIKVDTTTTLSDTSSKKWAECVGFLALATAF